MLYNPNWQRGDPFSIEEFSAWLSTKPKNEVYHFSSPQVCAVAQYLQSRGYSVDASTLNCRQLEELGWYDIVYPMGLWNCTRTFGHAAKIARRMVRRQKIKALLGKVFA